MDNKMNNMLNDFFENVKTENDEELDQKLQEFIKKYNAGEIEYVNTKLDDAYDLLKQAQNAPSQKRAVELAKQAYEMCPDCFDAILILFELEKNCFKKWELLNKGLEAEKNRLKEKGYFENDIGSFYGIFETRPYIRGLHTKAYELILEGKLTQAKEVCKEVLRLNTNDNMGVRYLLMSIYAMLEDEKNMLKLYKKYPEEGLEMLFPLFSLYYKLGDDEKAQEYLNRINQKNPHFIKLFKGTIKPSEDDIEGYYRIGDASEVIMYFTNYFYLLDSTPSAEEYILKNSKKVKRLGDKKIC